MKKKWINKLTGPDVEPDENDIDLNKSKYYGSLNRPDDYLHTESIKVLPPQKTGWINKLSGPDIEPDENEIDPNAPLYYPTSLNSPDDFLHPIKLPSSNIVIKKSNKISVKSHDVVGSLNMGIDTTNNTAININNLHISEDPTYYFRNSISEELLHKYLEHSLEMDSFFMWCQYYDDNGYPYKNFLPDDSSGILKPSGPGPSRNPVVELWISGDDVHIIDSTPYYININTAVGKNYYLNNILTNQNFQIAQDMQMLRNLKPKFLSTGGIFTLYAWHGSYNANRNTIPLNPFGWTDNLPIGQSDNPLQWIFTFAKINIDYYHQYIDPDTIFSTIIFEQCDTSFNNIIIPDDVLAEFGWPLPSGTKFNIANMVYPLGDSYYENPISHNVFHMELNLIETQMWIYFLAIRYIDCGYESIYFGDTFTMSYNDTGNVILWHLVQKVRVYASTRNRGIVLCSGTSFGDPDTLLYYYDPVPVPAWQRLLIFDYAANKIPISRRFGTSLCHNGYGHIDGADTYRWGCQGLPYATSNYPAQINNTHYKDDIFGPVYLENWYPHILYDNKGGLHPQGWLCVEVPIILAFDVTNPPSANSGCNYPRPDDWYDYIDYGFEEFAWFGLHSYHNRNEILIYIYNRIKCINPFSHLVFMGRNNAFYTNNFYNRMDHTIIYRANDITSFIPESLNHADLHDHTDLTGVYGQETTIKKIWNNDIDISPNKKWVYHNFTNQNVANSCNKVLNGDGTISYVPFEVPPSSSLLFVGDNMIFFIGNDTYNYIHGYIKVNNNTTGGTWLTVSPSYSAEGFYTQPVSSQWPALSNLVASPDGRMLLYIGSDGYIHGFKIISIWEYKYIIDYDGYWGFMHQAMLTNTPSIKAINCLIFPDNNRIYFIGEDSVGNTSIYGIIYQSGVWSLISVAQSAASYYLHPVTVSLQAKPVDSLTYDIATNRLYYSSAPNSLHGNFHYYNVIEANTYNYNEEVTANSIITSNAVYYSSIIQNISIVGNLAITGNSVFFIGKNNLGSDGTQHIYVLVDTTGMGNFGFINLFEYFVSSGLSIPAVPTLAFNYLPSSGINNRIAISPNGSKIAFFGFISSPLLQNGIVFFVNLGLGNYDINFLDIDYNVAGTESCLQFKNNNELYFIAKNDASDSNNSVRVIKFESDYCGKSSEIINNLWPLDTPIVLAEDF